MTIGVLALAALLLSGPFGGEQGPDVSRYVELAAAGQLDEVKKDLPSLVSAYPDDPGVMYLRALVTPEGSEAVKIYQSIVDNHPRSEWADDALYKISQFYQALGLVRTAELKMAQLRREYPLSRYVTGKNGTNLAVEERPSKAGAAGPPPDSEPAARAPAKIPPPSASPAKDSGAEPDAREFALQVGAFSTEPNADKLRKLFAGLGYPVEVIRRAQEGRTIYLVWVGRYGSEEEARSHIPGIRQQQSITPMVVKR